MQPLKTKPTRADVDALLVLIQRRLAAEGGQIADSWGVSHESHSEYFFDGVKSYLTTQLESDKYLDYLIGMSLPTPALTDRIRTFCKDDISAARADWRASAVDLANSVQRALQTAPSEIRSRLYAALIIHGLLKLIDPDKESAVSSDQLSLPLLEKIHGRQTNPTQRRERSSSTTE